MFRIGNDFEGFKNLFKTLGHIPSVKFWINLEVDLQYKRYKWISDKGYFYDNELLWTNRNTVSTL